jgi:hypothetical protein
VSTRFTQVIDFITAGENRSDQRCWQVIEISDKLSFAASLVSDLQQKQGQPGVFPRGLAVESAEFAS